MARHDFTASLRTDDGLEIVPDIDCELELDAEFSEADGVTITVTAIWIEAEESWHDRMARRTAGDPIPSAKRDLIDLLASKRTLDRVLAAEIVAQAEDSEWLLEAVMKDESVAYRGLGANDPDGRFIQEMA